MGTSQRVAIVTGVSRGFGFELARNLLALGWRVVGDARDREALAVATTELTRTSGHFVPVNGDVTDPAHRRALIEAAGPRIDLLVNNAGSLGPSPLEGVAEIDVNALARLFLANVFAPIALIQAALPKIADGAAIVSITSDAAGEAYPGWGPYGASKAALDQATAVLGVEHPELRVYSFDPGEMRTRMHQDAFPGEDISDRPLPETSVPALLALIDGDEPSGRYTRTQLDERVGV
jgi:NAD(P)-dependent dehydrogenase (short-subunit alcohol dehydrogenase family)